MSTAIVKSFASAPIRFTGSTAISESITETRRWKIRDVKIHLSDLGLHEALDLSINSPIGPQYNTLLFHQDMTTVQDLVWIPLENVILEALDTLVITWLNPNGRTYGLEIRYDFI